MTPRPVVGVVGDLVEDVVVRIAGPVNHGSDTPATIVRRQGGSAANVAARVAGVGGSARFIGQVGDDALGDSLVAALASLGVDTRVQRRGRTGSIVVLVDERGERSMFPDRAAAAELEPADRTWLDGLALLHVPMYSLVGGGALSGTSAVLVGWAHERGVPVSIDASSVGLLAGVGIEAARAAVLAAKPSVLFANDDEARVLGLDVSTRRAGIEVVVVKRGALPAHVLGAHADALVEAIGLDGVSDTTGAGDAFAAGYLVAIAAGADPVAAARAGHAAAADFLVALGACRVR